MRGLKNRAIRALYSNSCILFRYLFPIYQKQPHHPFSGLLGGVTNCLPNSHCPGCSILYEYDAGPLDGLKQG